MSGDQPTDPIGQNGAEQSGLNLGSDICKNVSSSGDRDGPALPKVAQ